MAFFYSASSLCVIFQFVTFCEKLARVMKLDEIADDVGLDVNGEALLARGEQLVKLEVSFLHSIRVNLWNVDFNTVHFFSVFEWKKMWR